MTGVKQALNLFSSVTLFTVSDKLSSKDEVVDYRISVSPALEQIVIFKKRVMPITGMCNDQSLHGHAVFFHQVGNTRVAVNHYFIGEPHLAAFVTAFNIEKLFTVGPVVIANRHTNRSIGIHHLIRADDLDLIRIGV